MKFPAFSQVIPAAALLVCAAGQLRAGTLNGSFSAIPAGTVINLTAAGPVDWTHWGLYTSTSLDRKAGVNPQISNFTALSNSNTNAFVFVYQYGDNPNGYSWSDGTPNMNVTNTTTGVWAYGLPQLQTGFQITVPADTSLKTLKVYVGVFAAQGFLSAWLSDASAPGYTNSSLNDIRASSTGAYTLEFAANSPVQILTIQWTLLFFHSPSGNVTLQSAALTATNANNPPFVSLTTPADNSKYDAGSNISLSADANDLDGIVAKVEFYDRNTKLGTATTVPYNFTWNNVPAGLHVLTAVATDNNADFGTSMPVEIFVNGTGGSLSASEASPPSTVDLTQEGAADWAHWGLVTGDSFDHKSAVPQEISNISVVGTNALQRYADNFTAYSWTDGTPVPAATNSTTGVFVYGLNNGFQIRAPADTNMRSLKVYAGLYGAQGNFQAWLSDFSARAFTDTSISNEFDSSYVVYTLDYAAASAGQSLFIEYRPLGLYDQDFGNVTLQAATLVGTNVTDTPPTVNITNPTNGQSFAAPATINITANASDNDGTVTNVQFFQGTKKLGQSTNSPYTFVWTNVPSGAYSLSAAATDNLGASTTSPSIDITVITITNTPILQLTTRLFQTNGAYALSIFPTVAQPYALDASLNLTNWISIFTNQTGDTASNFLQTPLTSPAIRFFRGRHWP